MLKRIEYVGVATVPFSSQQIDKLVAQSQTNNAVSGVTGALMASGSVFFQMLEGATESVDEFYRRISRDPRHTSIHLLRSELTRSPRMYADWSMRLVQPDDVVVGDSFDLRKGLERLDALHRPGRQITDQLERQVWTTSRASQRRRSHRRDPRPAHGGRD